MTAAPSSQARHVQTNKSTLLRDRKRLCFRQLKHFTVLISKSCVSVFLASAKTPWSKRTMHSWNSSKNVCPSTFWTLSRDGLNRFIQHSSGALSGVSIGFWVCHCCFQLPVTWFHHSGCSISFNHLVCPCVLPFQRHHEASAKCAAEIQAKCVSVYFLDSFKTRP